MKTSSETNEKESKISGNTYQSKTYKLEITMEYLEILNANIIKKIGNKYEPQNKKAKKRKNQENWIQVATKIPPETHKELEEYAALEQSSLATIVRKAINEKLAQNIKT